MWALIISFAGIVLLDIVLSGDNAVIVGALAASLPTHQRKKALIFGMSAAVLIRVILCLFATYLVTIPFLRTIGGFALFYVAYGMYKDLTDDDSFDGSEIDRTGRSFFGALAAIMLADLSMSIDNILAVAGIAAGHWEQLIFGLILSIGIMAFCASIVAKLIDKYKWIAWVGFGLIIFVACKLIYEDAPNIISYF